MREQVITPRASNRSGVDGRGRATNGGIVQRPTRRARSSAAGKSSSSALHRDNVRAALRYIPLAAKIILAIAAGLLIFAGYRATASASFFQAHKIDLTGATRASSEDIKEVARRAVAHTGVWHADLTAISANIEKLPWVRTAIVSRVLPDGLRIRVEERVPRAVVRTSTGRFVWVDDDGVSLGAMSPKDNGPAFFMRGWEEADNASAREMNRARIQKYLEMLRAWDAMNLTARVSEVDLNDLRDVRAQLSGDDAQIEVRLGGEDFGNRLAKALKVLDAERTTAVGSFVTHLDVTQDKKVVVGHSATAQLSDKGDEYAGSIVRPHNSAKPLIAHAKEKNESRRKEEAKARAKKKDVKGTNNELKRETRPRRVG